MISAQYGREFTNSEYGKIKKVYSIWICINTDAEHIVFENDEGSRKEK